MSVSTVKVTEDEADIRLDRWFRRHFPGMTQGAIQKLCRTGQVRVDGARVDAAVRLTPGQAVRVPPLPSKPAPPARHVMQMDEGERRDLEKLVIYRDEQVLVLNKPAGLATQGGPGITRHLDGRKAKNYESYIAPPKALEDVLRENGRAWAEHPKRTARNVHLAFARNFPEHN